MTNSPITTITDELLAELEQLAGRATPGRFYDRLEAAGGGIKYHCYGEDGSVVLQVDHKNGEFGFIGPKGEEDEKFFLACTPATILALLQHVRDLRVDAERYQLIKNGVDFDTWQALSAALPDELDAVLDAARSSTS